MIVQLLGGALAVASPFLALGAVVVGGVAHLRAKKEKRPFMTVLGEMLRRAGDDNSRGPRSGLNPWIVVGLRVGLVVVFIFILDGLFSKLEKTTMDMLNRPLPVQTTSQPPAR